MRYKAQICDSSRGYHDLTDHESHHVPTFVSLTDAKEYVERRFRELNDARGYQSYRLSWTEQHATGVVVMTPGQPGYWVKFQIVEVAL